MFFNFLKNQFLPTDIPNLAVWLDASTTTTGALSTWPDKSGNGNDATQGTPASQPTNGTNLINGKNTINFQQKSMSIADVASLRPGSAGVNIFVVCQNRTDSGNEFNIIRKWGPLSWLMNYKDNDTPDKISFGISENGVAADFVLFNQPSRITPVVLEFKGASSTSTNSQFWVSGVSAGTSTMKAGAGSGASIAIGETATSYNMDIAEILIYMRELSSTESNQVKIYLANKWNVSVS